MYKSNINVEAVRPNKPNASAILSLSITIIKLITKYSSFIWCICHQKQYIHNHITLWEWPPYDNKTKKTATILLVSLNIKAISNRIYVNP